VLAGVLVWTFGLAGFDGGELGLLAVLGCTVLGLPYVVLALGEDLGWRGLMTTRLAGVAGPRTVVLATGLVWGMFHWPLMLFLGGTPAGTPLWFALTSFTIGTAALGAILASMQLRWGIWPGLVVHAMVNAGLYHVVGPLTTDTEHSGWCAGEVGLFQNLLLVLAAVAWWRFAPLRRTPDGRTAA
jgi:membrane protease YdiL (CAAX protease family)